MWEYSGFVVVVVPPTNDIYHVTLSTKVSIDEKKSPSVYWIQFQETNTTYPDIVQKNRYTKAPTLRKVQGMARPKKVYYMQPYAKGCFQD